MSRPLALLLMLPLFWCGTNPRDDSAKRIADQTLLKPFAGLVGEWRGTGQPQRGSARGAWTETGVWAWKLTKDSAALELVIEKGKHFKSATLRPSEVPGEFSFIVVLEDGTSRAFVGKATPKTALIFVAKDEVTEGVSRVTITPLHDTRFLMLLETGTASRLAEVGYTRKGAAFAAGDSAPKCIVTGGRGTIAVSYKGKSYFVCCSGCKELFDENPEAVLAEAKAKTDAK